MLDIIVLVWPPLHPTISNNAQQDAGQCWDLLSEMLRWFGWGLVSLPLASLLEESKSLYILVKNWKYNNGQLLIVTSLQ